MSYLLNNIKHEENNKEIEILSEAYNCNSNKVVSFESTFQSQLPMPLVTTNDLIRRIEQLESMQNLLVESLQEKSNQIKICKQNEINLMIEINNSNDKLKNAYETIELNLKNEIDYLAEIKKLKLKLKDYDESNQAIITLSSSDESDDDDDFEQISKCKKLKLNDKDEQINCKFKFNYINLFFFKQLNNILIGGKINLKVKFGDILSKQVWKSFSNQILKINLKNDQIKEYESIKELTKQLIFDNFKRNPTLKRVSKTMLGYNITRYCYVKERTTCLWNISLNIFSNEAIISCNKDCKHERKS
jgi:hypothetical protein